MNIPFKTNQKLKEYPYRYHLWSLSHARQLTIDDQIVEEIDGYPLELLVNPEEADVKPKAYRLDNDHVLVKKKYCWWLFPHRRDLETHKR